MDNNEEKTKSAKDKVKLKHIETKKQKVDDEAINRAKSIKEKVITRNSYDNLNNDEITIIESIQDKRMFLNRIALIANQSRIPIGKEPFKKAELEDILSDLISKGYVTSEIVIDKRVYYLTERGRERIV
ncbi:MAG: hypothetical protein EU547_05320 [Promethearchaeota archaeon]|nr:MAG: hypothetical protein EU547_05320 [Candidatus Lokiarchaeota archaeon]